ncbi:diacylglycerol kinase family protein [Subtercola lobariae]|uniref:diacylglycerol kinase family protein n=1 Tax=Subtercola lobariae TaxID=1588641 RepID=UPI001E3BFDB8|nr:diacylglycerol kinase family protein [Subtercola lobariae]
MPETTPSGALRLVVAINPSASFGRTHGAGTRVVEALRHDGHHVDELQAVDFATLKAEAGVALAGHPDALIVVGGDGMVSLGVNLLAETQTPLGIVPTGTGNDSALGLGIPFEFDAALAHLRAGLTVLSALSAAEPRPLEESVGALASPAAGAPAGAPGVRTIDLGRLSHAGGELWFASALSAGLDALINERANQMRRPRGASRYTIALLIELLRLRARTYSLVVDGVARKVDSVLLTVANNRSIGGGMLVAPDASLDDGALDLFIVAPVSRLKFLRIFPRVFKGTHSGLDIVELTRVHTVEVDAPDIIAYADGERVGPLPVTVTVAPGALRVLA